MNDLQKLKQTLMEKYPYKLELHCHSNPASGCSELPPAELVKRCKNAGADGLVLTNHAIWWMKKKSREEWCAQYLQDYLKTKAAGEEQGLAVFLGFELRFTDTENDYLVFGFDEDFIPTAYDWMDKTTQEFYDEFHGENVLMIQAHPYRDNMVAMGRECVDGYEVFNLHPHHNSRVAIAARLHQSNGGVIIGGTDLHHPGHEGCLLTCFAEMPSDGKHLVRLLRSGDYIFSTGDKIILG